MGKPKAPAPPDPKETASAQTGTNIGTAIANNTMGMVDQYGPTGSQTYDKTGTERWKDPFTGKVYNIPTYSSTTSLSDAEQGIYDQNAAARGNIAGTAADQSAFLRDYLAQPADYDTSAIEGRLDELGSARLDPRFAREEESMRARLANQGIAPGSEAYGTEAAMLAQDKNDAYNQLYLTGRGQALSELFAKRNQPINEISALLSGGQVNMPQFSQYQPQGAATTDVAGLIGQNYNQQQQNYQQKNAAQQGLLGGLFGLGSSAIMASDVRLKEDILPIGTTNGGLPIYTYRYKGDAQVRMGVMAQDVEKVHPEAVAEVGGFKAVDYRRIS